MHVNWIIVVTLVMNVICVLNYVLGPSRDVVSAGFKTVRRRKGAYSCILGGGQNYIKSFKENLRMCIYVCACTCMFILLTLTVN